MTSQKPMTTAELLKTYFPLDYCIGCAERVPCYTDPETGCPICLACIETESEAASYGLHYTDPLVEADFPTPDAGNGYSDRTNPKLRTIGTR